MKGELILIWKPWHAGEGALRQGESEEVVEVGGAGGDPGTNCIKIGLPGKLILCKRKGLQEVPFS